MTNNRLNWIFHHLKIESPYGRKALSELKPFKAGDEQILKYYLNSLYSTVLRIRKNPDIYDNFHRIFMELRNIQGTTKNLFAGSVLDETELFEVKNFAILMTDLLDLASKEELLFNKIDNLKLKSVIKLLNPDSIVTRSFYIHESWSERLREIRNSKKQIESAILAEKDSAAKELLRSKRMNIVNEEKEEEANVRRWLSSELKQYAEDLAEKQNFAGNFELMLAQAELVSSKQCCVPEILCSDSDNNFTLVEGVEPELAEGLEKKDRCFTPVSIELQRGVTILTGANMGGKTVALKTIALNVELVRYGFLPFAQKMSLTLPDFIEEISGDSQNELSGLSSFGGEIRRLTDLLEKIMTEKGLVICDEFGRSTNPFEGSRFVLTLADRLQNSRSYSIIATHYDGINTTGAIYYRVAGLKEKAKEFLTLKRKDSSFDLCDYMDYHLIKSSGKDSVPHEALNVATLMGLPEDFIESLKKLY